MRHTLPLLRRLVFLLVVLTLFLPGAGATAQGAEELGAPAYVAGEVLIGWEPGEGPVPVVQNEPERMGADRADPAWQAAAATISRLTGLEVLAAMPEHGTARLAVQVGAEAAEIERLERLPWVRYAELNYYAWAAGAGETPAFYPNDPDFSKQWNMHRTKAAEAWSLTRGSISFVVAVLDTGIQTGHPEFAGRLVDPVYWYNYVADKPGAEDDDPGSHGTHVAGIIAARMNNGQGVTGLAPEVRILPLKVLDSQRKGRVDVIAAAIFDAADRGAQVINLSLATFMPSQALQDAVIYAHDERRALVVAAAGNCAQNPANCGGQVNPDIYPAAYSNALAVSSSDRFDRATIYSGYKPYIGLAAPGGTPDEPIWSTIRGGYGPMYGTSMSTPLVSAAAALVWTLRPGDSADQVADILKGTADKVGTDPYSGAPLPYSNGRNDYFGSGRLNVENAVRRAYPPSVAASATSVTLLVGGSTSSSTHTLEITNPSGRPVYWQPRVISGAPWLTPVTAAGTASYGYPAPLALRADRGSLAPGIYTGVVRVQPVDPPDAPPIDITVMLHVAATLRKTYAPMLAQTLESAWLDPDAPGSLYRKTLTPANDSMVTVALPFPVTYYGASQQVLQVSDNGFVIFGAPNGASGRAPAECPGNALPPNNAIYVLSYDWNPALGSEIVVHRPDADKYVVTWRNMRRSEVSPSQAFQLVITSASEFQGNYRLLESPLVGAIGAENYDGAFAQQVFCNGAGRQVRSGESVPFAARLPW